MMRTFFAALALLVLMLAAALLLFPYLVPQSYVQRQLGRLLAHETGLHLQDARRLSLSVFPRLGIGVEDVSASLPGGLVSAPIVRADRIFTAIRPSSLFGKRPEVTKVTIENPSILFHVDASGRTNWDLTGLVPDAPTVRLAALGDSGQIVKTAATIIDPGRQPKPLPSIDIDIINGSLAYHDEVRSRKIEAKDFDLSLRASQRGEPVTLEGGLMLEGQPVRLSAKATPSHSGADRSAALTLDIRSDAMSANLGGLLSWRGRPQFSGTAKLDLRSGAGLTALFGGKPENFARFDGTALSGRLDISNQDLVFAEGRVVAPGAEGNLSAFADFDGHVRAKLDRLALHGGQAEGNFTLDTRQPEAVLAGSFKMTGVDHLALAKALSGFDWLSGRADAEIEVAGGGKSLEAIGATLQGKGRISLAEGAIEGLDLPLIVAKVQEGEFGAWRREAGRRTQFDSLAATFTIENGIAETKDLALSGPNVSATGEGKTDIPNQKLNYRLKANVTPRGEQAPVAQGEAQQEASLTVPLIIKGDWDDPDIKPDVENALKDTDSLVGTAKLFGKSVEKLTDGKIKADEFGKALDSLFGKKKKKKKQEEE